MIRMAGEGHFGQLSLNKTVLIILIINSPSVTLAQLFCQLY